MSAERSFLISCALGLLGYIFPWGVHATTYEVRFNIWELIAIPVLLPKDMNTPVALFGDEFASVDPSAQYEKDWIMYYYDSQLEDYRLLGADEPLQIDKGYWINQAVADEITLKLPAGAVWAGTEHSESLFAELECSPDQLVSATAFGSMECIDPAPVQCPAVFSYYALTASNPASWDAQPDYDVNADSGACSFSAYPSYEVTNDDPMISLGLSDRASYDPSTSTPPSWWVQIETRDGRVRTMRSDDEYPPTRAELNECALLVGCSGFFDIFDRDR